MALGEKSFKLAVRSGNPPYQVMFRATWADALHQVGRWEERATAFREAEAMRAEQQPRYSLGAFWYCDLLLGQAEPKNGSGLDGLAERGSRPEETERFRQACRDVLERANEALRVTKKTGCRRGGMWRELGSWWRRRGIGGGNGRCVGWRGCWDKKAVMWCKIASMQLATGTVVDGKIVVEGEPLPEGSVVTILAQEAEADRHRTEQLKQSLSHPHPDSLEMSEAGFAAWAEGLPEDASDLIAPDAGEEVRWTADQGWVGTGE